MQASSDDYVEGHDGQKAIYLQHKAISRCINGPVEIWTSCFNRMLPSTLPLFCSVA